jgi:hypothetical protein
MKRSELNDMLKMCAAKNTEIEALKARIAELEGVDASLESRHKKDEQAEQSHDQRIAVLVGLAAKMKSALGSIKYWWENYLPNVKEFPIGAMYAAIAEYDALYAESSILPPEPDPNVRYILTAPVPDGNAWWNIVRQIQRDEEWIPSPDYALVNVSIRTPNAEAVARKLLSDLQALSKEEA